MKSKLRRLTLAALLISNTSMTFAEDGATTVGDLPEYEVNSKVIPTLPAAGPSANHVGDLNFIGSDGPNTVSDLGSNYVTDDGSNVVSDLGTNVVGDVVPNFTPAGERGTVVIGLAPSMLTDVPESARSNFVEAVPLPIITPRTTVVSDALIDPSEVAAAADSASDSPKAGTKTSKAEEKTSTPDDMENVTVQPFQAIGFKSESTPEPESKITTNCDCGDSCDGGCDSSHHSRLGRLFDGCPDDSWLSTEFLLWHTQDRDSPALIATSPAGTFPVLPDAQVVFGDKLEGEFSGGFRLDTGKYLTDNFAVGARFWILANNNDSFYADPRPDQISMGRPFFNTFFGTEDSLAISGPGSSIIGDAVGTGIEGTIWAESSVNMWAAEAYTRLRLNCNKNCKVDFLSGYSHLNLEDVLRISSRTIANPNDYRFHDTFETRNQFNGGQLGFELALTEGRLTFRSMTKVHLGNMNQRVFIDGSHSVTFLGDPVDYYDGGLLAQGNQGTYERNKFAFIPEVNFKLEYCTRKNVKLSLGYSFLYFDNVALAGSQVDRNIDPFPVLVPGNAFSDNPSFTFNDSGMWVQGLDFGVRWDF
jgi:hypothetical protein